MIEQKERDWLNVDSLEITPQEIKDQQKEVKTATTPTCLSSALARLTLVLTGPTNTSTSLLIFCLHCGRP
jgi:hypothetical protein